jgi:hypothetical protein
MLAQLPSWARRAASRRALSCARQRSVVSSPPRSPASRAPRTPPRASLDGLHPVVYHPDFAIQPLPGARRHDSF